jgi:hypothetical protein
MEDMPLGDLGVHTATDFGILVGLIVLIGAVVYVPTPTLFVVLAVVAFYALAYAISPILFWVLFVPGAIGTIYEFVRDQNMRRESEERRKREAEPDRYGEATSGSGGMEGGPLKSKFSSATAKTAFLLSLFTNALGYELRRSSSRLTQKSQSCQALLRRRSRR